MKTYLILFVFKNKNNYLKYQKLQLKIHFNIKDG
jgi:hypothetical protein